MRARASGPILALVIAVLGVACAPEPSTDDVREMERALDAIPFDPRDGTIAEDRMQAFLGVRRAIFQVELGGRAAVDELRRANEGSQVPSMSQINRVRRHTTRVRAARAKALGDAKMSLKEYAHVMNALADIAWEPEAFRPDGLTPVELANARLFQAHAREIREVTDMESVRAQRAKAGGGRS
jgi:hypothetical protein